MNEADTSDARRTLDGMRLHWDEAYEITYSADATEPYRAKRLDDGHVLSATTPAKLRDAIIDDYSVRPVPARPPHQTQRTPPHDISQADQTS
jgi:hypothetical protein